jgi:uracil-DNA glycosylase family 4
MSLEHHFSAALVDESEQEKVEALYPAAAWDGPGMPAPGSDFVQHAIELGDEIDTDALKKKKVIPTSKHLDYLYRRAMYDEHFTLKVIGKRGSFHAQFIPGHIAGQLQWEEDRLLRESAIIYGPKPARIMVVGKVPGLDNLSTRDALAGNGCCKLIEALGECGVPLEELASWYVTFACKFSSNSIEIDTLQASWLKDSAPITAQELRLVKPDYILCLGADATKAILGGPTKLNGRVGTIKIPLADGTEHEAKVMTTLHPAYVAKRPEAYAEFKGQLERFVQLTRDTLQTVDVVDHAEIYTVDALREMVDEMISDPDHNANIIAVDCEWHGEHPTEPGAYLRTIQVSHRDRWARTIVLRHESGALAFRPDLDAAKAELTRLLKSTADRHVRIGGHFLRADLPWLLDFGVDVRPEYAPAADVNDRLHGGWDTSLMYHAVNETAKYGLDECSMKFTTAPTYWERLDKWKKEYCKRNKIKADSLGGYGECPSHILHPYANYDADVTRRIMIRFYGTNGSDGLLASDTFGNDCWLPYWTAHQASLAFLEMELTGLVIDKDRADELTTLFMTTQIRLLEEVRAELNWSAFNPKSHPQLAVALFGRGFIKNFANKIAVPEEAQTLDLKPIKTTGKRPRLWNDVPASVRDSSSPSTDKESLGILGHINPTAAKIRDYKFIAQVLQSVLRKPTETDEGDFELDDDGNYKYEKGLVGCVHADGKVRTHLFQTKETGRASSSRPPLQNLSSRREDDYKRILGANYQHPVRSILRVPEGCVGIETDLTGAELAVLAWLSQDRNMIEHVRRNLLPENHPDHYDIHSRQACKTFNLNSIEPTKTGLVKAGKKGLRIAAKNVNFGIPYGRGSEAIARQCKEEGVEVTPAECQAMIDAYFDSYPGTSGFLAECRERSQNPGWLVGPYGRYRRFVSAGNDRAVIGEQQRQAQNFPIQGGVADAVSLALTNFLRFREQHSDVKYDVALQIHDAIMIITPIEHAEFVYKEVVPKCMVNDVPFWPRKLDGTLIDVPEPYHFGADRDVFVHWGEKLKEPQIKALGLDWLLED